MCFVFCVLLFTMSHTHICNIIHFYHSQWLVVKVKEEISIQLPSRLIPYTIAFVIEMCALSNLCVSRRDFRI